MADSRILQLSSIIARNTHVVDGCCKQNNIPSPSLDVNAPPFVKFPDAETEALEAQFNIITAARELSNLMRPPVGMSRDTGYLDAFVLQFILRFGIAQAIPVGEDRSLEEISQSCNVQVSTLRRILRYASTNGLFRETKPGHISHTSRSRLLAEHPVVAGSSGLFLDEAFPAAARGTDALQMFPGSEEPTETGWGLAFNAQKPLFAELHEKYPARHRNVTFAMDAYNSVIPSSPLVDNYPWDSVDLVVDIGGGHGGVSRAIAKQHSRPKFIVQDLANVVADGPSHIPKELQERISFQAHDMFHEQPVKQADVMLFRSVFHDWPDKYCVQLLKALVPAMRPGARVVLNEICMPPQGSLPPAAEMERWISDLHMLIMFGAGEREEADWARLFARADSRFKFLGVRLPDVNVEGIPQNLVLSIIEAVWDPSRV